MTKSIDERIVEMRFDNAGFNEGVEQTASMMDRLKGALRFNGGTKSISELQAASNKFDMANMAANVDTVASRFGALGAVGFSVIQELTQQTMRFAGRGLRMLAEPVLGGGRKRALNMEQANFQFEGLDMNKEKAMESALYAVKDTAFGLDEAAVLAANFGATGMKAGKEMSEALRGVSGVAAMAGASYSDIGQIFGTVAGQGRLMGNDLNRLAARGVNAAATLADQMGITESEVREMVSEGKVSFQEFAEAMNDAFGEQATKANETYTGSLSNMKAAFARTGAAYFINHLTRQRDLFNAITPLIDRMNDSMGPLVRRFGTFLDLKYENFIKFLDFLDDDKTGTAIFDNLMTVIDVFGTTLMSWVRPIQGAFGDIFGGGTVKGAMNLLDTLRGFINQFRLTNDEGENLRRTFAGIFAVFDIAFYVVGQVLGLVGRLVGYAFEGSAGFLEFSGSVGDFLVNLRDAIKEGTFLNEVLGLIEAGARGLIDFVRDAGGTVGEFFGDILERFDFSFLKKESDGMAASLSPFEAAGRAVAIVWEGVVGVLSSIWDFAAPAVLWVIDAVKDFMGKLAEVFRSDDFDKILDVINTGLLASIVLLVQRFFENMNIIEARKSLIQPVMRAFYDLRVALEAYQLNLKADTLMKIAIAIGVLTLSLIGLAMLDPAKLTKGIAGLAAIAGILLGAMFIFTAIVNTTGFFKMPVLAAGLILLAAALNMLVIPVMLLGQLDWESLAKGLAGIAGIMGVLAGAATLMSGISGSFIRIGLAMIPLAIGVTILSVAVKNMADMSWEEIGKGLTTLAGALGAIGIALMLIPSKGIFRKGLALVYIAGAITLLQVPLEKMGQMGWEEIAKGVSTLAGALIVMAGALSVMSGTFGGSAALVVAAGALHILMDPLERMSKFGWEQIGKAMTVLGGSLALLAGGLYLMTATLPGAAGLIAAAGALMMIIEPLERMGEMGWEEIGKAMTVLAGSLILLAIGLTAMIVTLPGSAGLVVAAAALALLAPVMVTLGGMSWEAVGIGLTALAGSLTILGIAGVLLLPAIPGLIGAGAALILVGAGMLAAGIGMTMLGTGVGILGLAVATSGTAILEFVRNVIGLIPELAIALATGLADFLIAFFENSSRVMEAFSVFLTDLLTTINEMAPQFKETFVLLLMNFLTAVQELTPEFRMTAVVLIMNILMAIEALAPQFASTMVTVINVMLNTLDENVEDFIGKGIDIVDKIIVGILSQGFGIEASAVQSVLDFIHGVDGSGRNLENSGSGIIGNVIAGIMAVIYRMGDWARSAVARFILGVTQKYNDLRTSGSMVLTQIRIGIVGAISGVVESVKTAATRIGSGIISGIGSALDGGSGGLFTKIRSIAGNLATEAMERLGVNSPSKVFQWIGKHIVGGWTKGIDKDGDKVIRATDNIAKKSIGSVEEALKYMPDLMAGMGADAPTIRPVVDLSDVRNKAGELSSIFGDQKLGASGYGQASGIARERQEQLRAQREIQNTLPEPIKFPEIKLEQHNTSPKALPVADIYRNTNNLLSTVRGALTK